MKITVVDAPSEPTEGRETPHTVNGPVVEDVIKSHLAEMFSLSSDEATRYQDKLDTLYAYAKAISTDHSPEALKWAVRDLQLKTGNSFSEKPILTVSRLAYLLLQQKDIEKEIKTLGTS